MLRKRLEKLERNYQGLKDAADALVIITPIYQGATGDNKAVIIDGKTYFIGTYEECEKWLDENIGPRKTIHVGANREI